MKPLRRTSIVLALVLALGAIALPAAATVDEIIGQWCADRGHLAPPGISGGSKANNFAQPLFASGVVQISPYDSDGDGTPDAALVDFDFDHPAIKVRPVLDGEGNQVIMLLEPGLYFELWEVDDSKPFANCKNLR